MKSRSGWLALGLLAWVVWAPTVLAGESPVQLPPTGDCATDDSTCSKDANSAVPAAPAKPHAPKSQGKALLDGVGSFFAGAAKTAKDAAGTAASAAAGAALATSGALAAAFRAYVDFLIGLKPDGMSEPVYMGIAAGSTAVATTGTSIGLWLLLRKLASFLPAMPLFSRIAKDELLENERRSRLYEMIRQNPGIHLSELSQNLELSWGSTLHHLRKLRADRLITFKTVGHHKCYFVNGSGLTEQQMQAASVVKGQTLEQVAAFIETHPQTNLKDLAAALRISSPLAAFHVAKLEKAGLVHKVRAGKSVRLALRATLPQANLTLPVGAAPSALPTAA